MSIQYLLLTISGSDSPPAYLRSILSLFFSLSLYCLDPNRSKNRLIGGISIGGIHSPSVIFKLRLSREFRSATQGGRDLSTAFCPTFLNPRPRFAPSLRPYPSPLICLGCFPSKHRHHLRVHSDCSLHSSFGVWPEAGNTSFRCGLLKLPY